MNQSLSYEIGSVMPMVIESGIPVSFASFMQPPTTQGATGNLSGPYVAVAGLQNILCLDAPESIRIVASSEVRKEQEIEAGLFRHILLTGYYQAVIGAAGQDWQVVILDPSGESLTYTLLGADADSQCTQTRCRLQLITL
jgi:hypothetical protein